MTEGDEEYGFDDDIQQQPEQHSDLSKVTEILLNNRWRRRKTILKERQISALATLETIANIWDVEFLKAWIPSYSEYRTSCDGKGRQDIVDITKFSIDRQNERDERMIQLGGRR